MNILFIDLETTGTDTAKHAVIEIACRLDIAGKTVSTFTKKFFNPIKTVIDLQALQTNKTLLGDLLKFGKEDMAVVELVDYLLQLDVQGPLFVCGHNIGFDLKFLEALLSKYDITNVGSLIGYRTIDTFSIALGLIAAGKLVTKDGKMKLEAVANGLGINTSGRNLHTAVADADLAAEVYYEMINRIRG